MHLLNVRPLGLLSIFCGYDSREVINEKYYLSVILNNLYF